MKTMVADLLKPYAAFLKAEDEKQYDSRDSRITVAVALVLAEAAHVAEVRNDQGEPAGGWKNELPLEHNTALGHFIRSCRDSNKQFIIDRSRSYPDKEIRATYEMLASTENVYIKRNHGLTTDELIKFSDSELYYAQ